ncbi:hypothetical protein B0H11DRAFT_2071829 [Mycena galericulata]|nr:hypothetical protein B0H11DRAFT_2071829 [Mycena galericulata]
MFFWRKPAVSNENSNPRLPEDLERQILEIAAFQDPTTVPTLLRVAKRTLLWLEPLLYRVLILFDEMSTITFLRDRLARKPDHIWRDGPRHLFMAIESVPDDVEAALAKCTGLQDLILYCDPAEPRRYLPHLEAMKLRHLGVNMEYLFGCHAAVDLRGAAFASLTHLFLLDDFHGPAEGVATEAERWAAQIVLLTCLTHLAFVGDVPREILGTVLERCKTLQVVVSLRPPLRRMTVQSLHSKLRLEDERFVIMLFSTFAEDWQEGARGGADFWARADEFVAAKRRREIDAAKYWTDDDMTI